MSQTDALPAHQPPEYRTPVRGPLHEFAVFLPQWGPYRSIKDYPDDWEQIRQLGTANFGKVFLYRNKITNEELAVKRMATDERMADGHVVRSGVLERYTQKNEGENPVVEIGAYTYINFGKNIDRKFAFGMGKPMQGCCNYPGVDPNSGAPYSLVQVKGGSSFLKDFDHSKINSSSDRSNPVSQLSATDLGSASTSTGGLTAGVGGGAGASVAGSSLMGGGGIPESYKDMSDIEVHGYAATTSGSEPMAGNSSGDHDQDPAAAARAKLHNQPYTGTPGKPFWLEHHRSRNLLEMKAVIMDSQYFYVATEPCARGELYELVAKQRRLDERLTRTYLRQAVSAVSWLHRHGIGHRDISLENILLTDEGDDVCIRLMDFGMSCNLYKPRGTATNAGQAPVYDANGEEISGRGGAAGGGGGPAAAPLPPGPAGEPDLEDVYYSASVGKDLYRPPELYHGSAGNSYRVGPVDVFCLGVVFFMMLTGKPLWKRCTLSDKVTAYLADGGATRFHANWERLVDGWNFREKFSASALDLIPRMIHFDPDWRYTIDQVAQHDFFLEPAERREGAGR
eukprot:g19076.t1